ncbi:MAG: hypothetical protein WAU86_18625 [Oricola sp.]
MSARIRSGALGAAWLRVVLLAAVVLSAFAHRPLVSDPEPFELARYVLPDGTLPEICTVDENGGGPAKHDHVVCDFCLIAGSSHPAEPVAEALSRPLPLLLAVIVPVTTAPPVVTIELATASKRGPPVLFS